MRTVLRRLGQTLPAGSAILMLAGCGSTASPTAPAGTSATATQQSSSPSIMVRAFVVDSATNQPLANVNIECMGSIQCILPAEAIPTTQQRVAVPQRLTAQQGARAKPVTAQQGDTDHVGVTAADGSFQFIAGDLDGSASGANGFMVGANARGYAVQWQQVRFPDPGCTSDNPSCAVTLSFALVLEPGL